MRQTFSKGSFYERHNDCELSQSHVDSNGNYAFFCTDHNQWAYIIPRMTTYTYAPETGLAPHVKEF